MDQRKINLVTCVREISTDGLHYGLLGFERVAPDADGDEALWIGVPVPQLPQLAMSALRAIPQPVDVAGIGDRPAVFSPKGVGVGDGANGELVMDLEFAPGMVLSVGLDNEQAKAILVGLQNLVGD